MNTIRLIGRAFRPCVDAFGAPLPEAFEALFVAFLDDAAGRRIVWHLCRTDSTGNPPDRPIAWNANIDELSPDKPRTGDLLNRPWERIDLFRRVDRTDPKEKSLFDAKARLSFDAVADERPHPSVGWTWNESSGGRPSPQRRKKADLPVSTLRDSSCLYLSEANGKAILVANVRLRNLLGTLGGTKPLDAWTWQFVLPLGAWTALHLDALWHPTDAELRLRDVLYCHDGGASLSNYLRSGRTLALESLAVDEGWAPLKTNPFAFEFSIEPRGPTPLSWLDGHNGEALKAGPVSFEWEFEGQAWGISFRKRDKSETVGLRFYASEAWTGEALGKYWVSGGPFLVQEQPYVGNRNSDDYRPRGVNFDRTIEWRLYVVRQNATDFAEDWNRRIVCPTVAGLRIAKDAAPVSFLPALGDDKPKQKVAWMAAVAVRDRTSNAATLPNPNGLVVSAAAVQPALSTTGKAFEVILEGVAAETRTPIRLKVTLRHSSLTEDGPDGPSWQFSSAVFGTDAPTFAFSLFLDATPARADWLRVGAFDLAIRPGFVPGPGKNPMGWTIEGGTRNESSYREGIPETCNSGAAPTVTVETRLPMWIRAGAVDRMQRDDLADVGRRTTAQDPFAGREIDLGFEPDLPVVIDLGLEPAAVGEAAVGSDYEALVLVAKEAVFDERSHNLTMGLSSQEGATPSARRSRRIMVIDRTPFAVYLARTAPLSSLASAEATEVAVWNAAGEGGSHWRLAEPERGIEIFLPPQGMGEAMEKAAGLGHPRDPKAGQPVDFRFTPHARLLIDPSFQDQRYGETPWNVRRLFGYAEQRVPGSWLTGFDLELLYGLSGRARGLERTLVAELESRLGRPAGRQRDDLTWLPDEGQAEIWTKYRRRWGEIRAQLLSRLGVLETYSIDGRELVVDVGLEWYQRGWKPTNVAPAADATPRLAFPKENYGTAKQRRLQVANAIFDETEGLAGGWTWGFESLNILDAVLRKPQSTSGFVSGLKFSALGGWGFQKASFDEDRTSIYGDTAMGRTHFYSLERIGRIGVFWNRAKHVIVFERSVAPSSQFAPHQDSHLGRPMLRKTEEYIELLEPDRAFPDSDAPKAGRGCVTGFSCRTKKIPVDSAWGQDVGALGWKVPLWNARAADLQPMVYPRPQLNFAMAADPEADVSTILGLCNTPDLIHFYTDTRPGTGADSDKWEPIFGVDYGLSGARWVEDTGPLPAAAGESMDETMPSEIAVPPGLHEFTFGIDPPERAVNLAADRADKALNAILRNVTLMRSADVAKPEGPAAKTLTEGSRFYQEARKIEQELKTFRAKATDLKSIQSEAIALVTSRLDTGSLKNHATNLKAHYDKLNSGDFCAAAKLEAERAFDRCSEFALGAFDKAGSEVAARAKWAETKIGSAFDDLSAGSLAKIRQTIDQALVTLAAARSEAEAEIEEIAAGLKGALRTASQNVLGVERTAIEGVDAFRSELLALRRGAEAKLREVSALTAKHLEWARQQDATVASAADALFGRIGELRAHASALQGQLGELFEKAERIVSSRGARLGKPGKAVLDALRDLRAKSARVGQRIDSSLAEILGRRSQFAQPILEARALLDALQKTVDSLRSEISNALTTVAADFEANLDQFENEIVEASVAVEGLLARLATLIDEIRNRFRTQCVGLETELRRIWNEAGTNLAKAWAELTNEVSELKAGAYFSQPLGKAIGDLRSRFAAKLAAARSLLADKVYKVCMATQEALTKWLDSVDDAANEALTAIEKKIAAAVDLDGIRQALESGANRIVGEAVTVYEQARQAIEASGVGEAIQTADRAIRLVRAFGDPPKVPKLDFNRAAAAFVFGDPKDAIDITPVTAWLDRVGDDLKALGIRLPTEKVLDRLIPPDLKNYDFGKLLPDFAGLKLDRLFPRLSVPAGMRDAVRVTHGLDKQRQRAWIDAQIDLRMTEKAELFAFGPLALTLHKANLNAFVRLDAGLDGKIERRSKGDISGDWQLDFGGQMLVTFRDTSLRFDESGHTKFDLSPDRIDLAPALRYLSDLCKQLQYEDDGFVFRILERNGIPYGAEALFDIALPPLQYGTSGLIGATIGAGMRLEAYPDFAIDLHLNVSRKDSPFIFSVFILGGAGYVESSARYLPFRNELTADVSIGIAASASLAFAFGPVTGQVAVLLGVAVEFHRQPGQNGGGLRMALTLLILGRVDLKGIVTVHLSLLLEAHYHETGRVTAAGTLRITVRISRFFKLSVSTRVQYDFKSGKSQQTSQRDIQTHPAFRGAKRLAEATA